MANKDTVKQTKEQIKALNELRKSQGGLNLEQSKTLDNLRQMLSELTGLEKRQKKLVDQGGTYTDLSKLWADNAMDQKKGAQELAGIQKSQLSLLAQAAKGELSAADIAQHRVDLEQQSTDIGKKYFGQNEDTGKELQEQIKVLLEHLKTVDELNATEQDRNDKAAELEANMGPLKKGWEDIKTKVGDFAKSLTSVQGVIGMIAGGLIAVGALLVKQFVGAFQGAMAMQKELGVGVGHALDLQLATQEAAAGGFMYGEGMEEVAARASTLVEEWGVINEETKNSIAAATDLERHYGVSTTAAANIAQMMESTSSSTKDVLLQDMGKEMKSLQKSGVPVGKIMEEVAGDTDFFAGHMKKGGKNIIKAASFAKKLGMSMSTISGAAESLLDWDSSINAEMEASVLLGRNLNFQRARELAFAGDLEGMQKEIMKQVGSEAEFAEMNVIARQALAEAAGVSVTDLAKMVAAEEKLANMSAKDLAKQEENEKITKNIQKLWGGITGIFQKMYNQFITPIMEKIKSMLGFSKDIGPGFDNVDGILAEIEPKIESLVKWVSEVVVKIIEWGKESYKFLKVMGTTEEGVFSFKKMATDLWEMFESKIKTVAAALGTFILVVWALNLALSANPVGAIIVGVMALIGAIYMIWKNWDAIVEYIKNSALGQWFSGVVAGIKEKFAALSEWWGGLITGIKDKFAAVGKWFTDTMNSIKEKFAAISEFFTGIGEKIKGVFSGIGEFFSNLWTGFEERIAALGELFSGIGEKIKGVFSGIGNFIAKMWAGLVTILKAPFNFIIAGWNMVIRGLNSISIDIPDWVPKIGGESFGFDVPEIPSLQTEVGEGHEIAAGGMARVHGGESVGRFDFEPLRTELSDTNAKLDKMIGLLSNMPTTDAAAGWARKQKSATEGAFANR